MTLAALRVRATEPLELSRRMRSMPVWMLLGRTAGTFPVCHSAEIYYDPQVECDMEDLIPLGRTGICISPLGLGTWQWGDYMVWGYGKTHNDDDLRGALHASLAAGINFLDTAEVYGRGRSERLLGEFLHSADLPAVPSPKVVASKFMPLPWRLTKRTLRSALRESLRRLRLERVELYQMHWPFPPVSIETWAEALADVVEAGLTRAVGVSNYSLAQMLRASEALSKRGIPLASNQVEYHLLNRRVEQNGLLSACHDMGVTMIAYSPLAKGMLTGKYTPENPPPGLRRRLTSRKQLARMRPLIGLMREMGQAHEGRTPAQVALNWVMCRGALPIPGAKNARQAHDNALALGWRLTQAEVAALDEESQKVTGETGL